MEVVMGAMLTVDFGFESLWCYRRGVDYDKRGTDPSPLRPFPRWHSLRLSPSEVLNFSSSLPFPVFQLFRC